MWTKRIFLEFKLRRKRQHQSLNELLSKIGLLPLYHVSLKHSKHSQTVNITLIIRLNQNLARVWLPQVELGYLCSLTTWHSWPFDCARKAIAVS